MKLYVKIEALVPLNDDEEACIILLDKMKEARNEFKRKRRTTRKSQSKCIVETCNAEAKGRHMCSTHYNRWYKDQPKLEDGTIDKDKATSPMEYDFNE